MATVLGQPGVDGLSLVDVLREWQCDGAPMQLHPGDLGWFWRFGAEATAAAVRTWSRDGQVLAELSRKSAQHSRMIYREPSPQVSRHPFVRVIFCLSWRMVVNLEAFYEIMLSHSSSNIDPKSNVDHVMGFPIKFTRV